MLQRYKKGHVTSFNMVSKLCSGRTPVFDMTFLDLCLFTSGFSHGSLDKN